MHRPLSSHISFNLITDLGTLLRDLRRSTKSHLKKTQATAQQQEDAQDDAQDDAQGDAQGDAQDDTQHSENMSEISCHMCQPQLQEQDTVLDSRYFTEICDNCDIKDLTENLRYAGIKTSGVYHWL